MPDRDDMVAAVRGERETTRPWRASKDAVLLFEGLARQAFGAWHRASDEVGDVVVCPSVPILFFGDVDAYIQSPLRIITVGLNPSDAEFPEEDRFRRFREAEGLTSLASEGDVRRYLTALSGYFGDQPEHHPYGWFRAYQGLLEGLDASFYKGAENTALHTDLCSAVATKPTWSKLPQETRAVLLGPGRDLWHDLVRVLRPHVMLISVAREHLDHIRFESEGGWEELWTVEREHPYIVTRKPMRLEDGTPVTAVFGRAAEMPFGTVSHQDKRDIGCRVRELFYTGQPTFVQFPHPGSERDAEGQDCVPWSTSDTPHTRKFLKAHGTYLDQGRLVSGPLAFWGEWEPPSRVVHTFDHADHRKPRWLHEPIWQGPVPHSAHNTDPLVFGDHFVYSNCRQRRQPNLRYLTEGSLILFGSATKVGGTPGFVLDTVLVVGHHAGERGDYTPASVGEIACQPIVRGVVLDPLQSDRKWSDLQLTLYRGRTYVEAPQGPFSFVPCKPCDDVGGCAFARPVIELTEPFPVAGNPWINPSAAMAARYQHASPDQLVRIWHEVVEQVRAQGLALAVHLQAPEESRRRSTAEPTPVRPARTGSC